MIGNEYTGDLTPILRLAEGDIRIKDNWVTFQLADTALTVQMKVFADGSTYGIGNGRISKLAIYDDAERQRLMDFHISCETHYDRGWDIEPLTSDAFDRCRRVVEALGATLTIRPSGSLSM